MGNDEDKKGWKQFQKLSFDSRRFSKRVKKAEGATMRHAKRFITTRLDNIRNVRRQVISWLLLIGVMLFAVGAQFMWFRDSYQTVAAAPGGTYAEGSLGPIETLNPLYASSSAEISASRLLFSSLYTYDSTGHLHGDLATSLQAEAGGTAYIVKLRSDAKWQDGTALTAKDVAFTVNLIKNPETRSPLRINWRDINVTAKDDSTLEFKLPATYAAFPFALTFPILPQHILSDVAPAAIRENTFSRSPTGSGPFSFRLLQSAGDSHKVVHMVANDHYYDGAPLLSRFEVHAYGTQEAIVGALRSGEVGAATDITGVDTSQIDTQNYDIINKPINSGVYALLNTASPLLKDKELRKALQIGTDTKAVRESLGVKVPALDLPFVNGQVTGIDVQAPSYDPTKAAAMLDASGWVVKDGIRQKGEQKLALNVITTKNRQYEKALETLAGQWRKLNIGVSTKVVDPNDPSINFVQGILQTRDYDVLLYELFIGADPDVYAYWHSSQTVANGYNFANYTNRAADDALASARSRLEPTLRAVKYVVFAHQWIDDAPAIGLYQATSEYAFNKHTHSLDTNTQLVSSYDRYADVLDWSVNQRSVYKTP
ncbi:MAG TPA: peptide ABC transporter substrate-binding protein [Candidatus Saccharimonadales bacterium]|nr:peptide ABC transporter substrate-binding protein [Candidatus Saccharimonadales bacterium]